MDATVMAWRRRNYSNSQTGPLFCGVFAARRILPCFRLAQAYLKDFADLLDIDE